MKATRIPRGAIVVALVGVAAWWWWSRRRAKQQAAADPNFGGWPIGAVPASFSYLTSAAPAPTDRPIGAMSQIDAAALAMLQALNARLAGGAGGATSTGGGTIGVTTSRSAPQTTWETSGTYPTPAGYSSEAVLAAARKYAAGRSYGGQPYVPIHTAQEGHIEVRGGVPGVMIKYSTPGLGASTEWTPLR
jgi:hypothetical protein